MSFRVDKAKRYSKRLENYGREIISLEYKIKKLQKDLAIKLEKYNTMGEDKEHIVHLADCEYKQIKRNKL